MRTDCSTNQGWRVGGWQIDPSLVTNIKVWRARALSWKPIRHSAIHYQYREVRNQIKSGEVMRDKSVV